MSGDRPGRYKLQFKGFDQNNDKHYWYAKFIIKDKGLYDEHENAYLNSHDSSTIDAYRRMLKVFNSSLDNYRLPKDALKKIAEVVY
ncbi:YfbU family protein [Adhaeribacter soli]|uniref:YfbU family protein n=1 Tax=Adhaeribacter soli TaxID=2607655 RepID=UPI001CD952DA